MGAGIHIRKGSRDPRGGGTARADEEDSGEDVEAQTLDFGWDDGTDTAALVVGAVVGSAENGGWWRGRWWDVKEHCGTLPSPTVAKKKSE
jgi:hypothetical protein